MGFDDPFFLRKIYWPQTMRVEFWLTKQEDLYCSRQIRPGGRYATESPAGGDIYLPLHDTGGQG